MYEVIECLNCGVTYPYCNCDKTDYKQRIESEPQDYGIDDYEVSD